MSGPDPRATPAARANARVAIICLAVFAVMVGAAFAAVPLYRLFCQATGFDGTVRRATKAPDRILDRTVGVAFDTNVHDLPWTFAPVERRQTVRIGETGLAHFRVTNTSDRPITGKAAYNVVPEAAGAYFQKLQCFCFSDQTIQPHQTVEFPVAYFVAPELATDPEARGIREITLSYTFYPSQNFDARVEADERARAARNSPENSAAAR